MASPLTRAGTAPGEFNRPEGLCVDTKDQVYVADSCNHRIQVFSCEGKLLRVYGKAGSGSRSPAGNGVPSTFRAIDTSP